MRSLKSVHYALFFSKRQFYGSFVSVDLGRSVCDRTSPEITNSGGTPKWEISIILLSLSFCTRTGPSVGTQFYQIFKLLCNIFCAQSNGMFLAWRGLLYLCGNIYDSIQCSSISMMVSQHLPSSVVGGGYTFESWKPQNSIQLRKNIHKKI